MKQKYRVLIIGAGNIGAFFDSPTSDNILTHAHAFTKHKGFDLVGFVDKDINKAVKATSVWGGKPFKDIKDAFRQTRVDVAIISVPDELHYNILKDLSEYSLKIILMEKPIARNIADAEKILKICGNRKIDIAVNYTRRFVPEFKNIRDNIKKSIYGKYLTGTGYYGKGILHNGSHLVDLLMFFLGHAKAIKPVSSIEDFYENDKTVSAVLTFNKGENFFLQSVDCRNYTVFEMDLFFEKKRIRIYDLGFKIEEYDVIESPHYKDYKNIVKSKDYMTSLRNAMYYVAENIYKNISEKQDLKCTARDGYRALKTSLAIKGNVNE